MNITAKQWLAIIGVIVGAIAASQPLWASLFGPQIASAVIGLAGFVGMVANGVITVISGQAATVKDTLAMPGVESISVNAKANQTLAAIAVDPAQVKIDAAPGAADAVQKIAKGA